MVENGLGGATPLATINIKDAWEASRLAISHLPSLTVLGSQILIRLGHVGDFQILRIPKDFFTGAQRNVTEEHGLGQRAGVIEVRQGFRSAFARVQPFLVVVTL